jgi:hypothetical protein
MASSQQNIKAKDGKIIEMQKTSDKKTETKEMVIPIQIQGRPAIEQKVKTPRPRMLPFEFPSLPSLSMPSLDMPSMGMMDMGMQNFNMPMQSASDMMAQMQAQMQQQMASMQHATMQQMQMQMQSAGTMHQQQMEKQQAMSSVHQQSSIQQTQQQTMESAQEMMHQDFFVPLKQINKVNKNALSEATAMAKMRDGMFELVVNIQGFEPEDIQVFCVDQAVLLKQSIRLMKDLFPTDMSRNLICLMM